MPLFSFVSNTISYGASAASSALYGGILTFVFVLYFSYAIELPDIQNLIEVVGFWAIFTTLLQGLYFGLAHKIGFSGVRKRTRLLNRAIQRGKTWFTVEIRDDLNADEYRLLHEALCYFPRENSIMSVLMVTFIISALLVYLSIWKHYAVLNLIQVGVIALVAMFVHAGFTAVISELVTGEMRARVQRMMHEKKIEFQEIALSTVRSKILFFIVIMVATLFVTNFMAFYGVHFTVMVRFSVFAIGIGAVMAYMLFAIILQSLREIEAASVALKEGSDAQLFPQTLDTEFINVATGFKAAVTTIRDYQHNLERKVDERTAELTLANETLNEKDRLIQLELDFASEIQKGIIPAEIEEWNGLRFFGYYKPMEKVSGDYYDVFPTQGNRLGVLMADVSGHGVPAALITTMAKVAFSRAAQNTASPAQTFREVNNQLMQIVTTQDYLTAFYVTIDEHHHFYFGNASHQHGKIVRNETGGIDSLDTGGLFVGAMYEASESYDEKEGRLYPNDRLYLYTDGLIEIRNNSNEEFGNARFDALLIAAKDKPASDVVAFIVGEVFRFADGRAPNDDISLLMVESSSEYGAFLQTSSEAYRLLDEGDRVGGAKLLDEAILLYGKNLKSLRTAGVLHFDLGHLDEAQDYLKRYIQLNQQNAEVYYYLSAVALQKNFFADAENYAREAIQLRSNFALAFNNLSIACINLEKYAFARYAIEKALLFDPENEEIRQNARKLEEFLKRHGQ